MFRLSDQFGPIPCKDYADLLGALQAAKARAHRLSRTIIVSAENGKGLWWVLPNKQVLKRKR